MSDSSKSSAATYYVDEAGDGVLFGRKGRLRLNEPDARQYFMLGMVRCVDDQDAIRRLEELRRSLLGNPLYAVPFRANCV